MLLVTPFIIDNSSVLNLLCVNNIMNYESECIFEEAILHLSSKEGLLYAEREKIECVRSIGG